MKTEKFTLKKEIDLCTAWIAHDIRSPRRRKQVREEYAAHLDDATYHHMMEGHSEEEAFLMAKMNWVTQRICSVHWESSTTKQPRNS